MPETVELTPALLDTLIHYNPSTGVLTWKTRGPEHFFGQQQPPEQSAKIWNSRNAGRPALNSVSGNGYLHGAIFGVTITAHKAAWAIYHGKWPVHGIDHENGDRKANRINNLRDVPGAVNSKNQSRRKTNTSGVTGVSWFARTNKWVAMIKGDGKVRNLGYFSTLEEAAEARKAAERLYGFHPNHGRKAA